MGPILSIWFNRIKSSDATFLDKRSAERIHLKRDGYAIIVHKTRKGELVIATRTPTLLYSELEAKPVQGKYEEVEKYLPNFRELPRNSIIFGEGFVLGETAHSVRSALAANPTKKLSFEIFCVDRWVDYCGDEGPVSFEKAESCADALGLPFVKYHERNSLTEYDCVHPPEGFEGYVLKDGQQSRGGKNWFKLKPRLTADLRIVGYSKTDPLGKYAHLIGGLRLESDDKLYSCDCGIMTDAERIEFSANQAEYLGKIVEIAYTERSESSFRHPRLERVRYDKVSTSY